MLCMKMQSVVCNTTKESQGPVYACDPTLPHSWIYSILHYYWVGENEISHKIEMSTRANVTLPTDWSCKYIGEGPWLGSRGGESMYICQYMFQ